MSFVTHIPHSPGAHHYVHHAGPRLHQVHERAPAGAKYIILSHIFSIVTKVTAREGKPILIVEEGDTETCKWAEHSLEVMMTTPYLPAAHTQIPYI